MALICQEFFLIPVGATSFAEAMKLGSETYHNLKAIIKKKYGSWDRLKPSAEPMAGRIVEGKQTENENFVSVAVAWARNQRVKC